MKGRYIVRGIDERGRSFPTTIPFCEFIKYISFLFLFLFNCSKTNVRSDVDWTN